MTKKPKKTRIIEQLRCLIPDGDWRFVDYGFCVAWVNRKTNEEVVGVSVHSPLYDGDEDRYTTRYMINWPNGKYLPIGDGRYHHS